MFFKHPEVSIESYDEAVWWLSNAQEEEEEVVSHCCFRITDLAAASGEDDETFWVSSSSDCSHGGMHFGKYCEIIGEENIPDISHFYSSTAF